jgi:hypothetical protein
MIVTQIEIAPQTAGLATLVIKHVLLTTILMNKVSAEPLTLTGIYLAKQSQTSCLTLRINYDSLQNVINQNACLISSSKVGLHRLAWAGAGESILEAINTTIIAIFLSLRRAMQMARSLMYP